MTILCSAIHSLRLTVERLCPRMHERPSLKLQHFGEHTGQYAPAVGAHPRDQVLKPEVVQIDILHSEANHDKALIE